MFKKLFRRLRGLPARQLHVGDIVTTPYKENEPIIAIRPSMWKGIDVQVEINEPFPYIGLPNPRRKVWMHETWMTLVRPLNERSQVRLQNPAQV